MSDGMRNGAETPAGTDRRTLLRGFAALGLAGVATGGLAACGGGDDGETAEPADSPTTSGGETPTSDGETPTPEGSETATSDAGGGEALVKTAEVPEGGGKILTEEKVVVTQPSSGQFKAFSAVCTHQMCTVGSVEDGLIKCPCHGSQYSVEDGSVKQGPATRALGEIPVTVQGDEVVRT